MAAGFLTVRLASGFGSGDTDVALKFTLFYARERYRQS